MLLRAFQVRITLCILNQISAQRPLYVFVHIPRTGGMNFGSALTSLVSKDFNVCHMRHISFTNEPWPSMFGRIEGDLAMEKRLSQALLKCDVLWDHFDYGVPELIRRVTNRDIRIITQLRPPVERFLSSHFKQYGNTDSTFAQSRLQSRINELETGTEGLLKHTLSGYFSGCAVVFDPVRHAEICSNFSKTYSFAFASMKHTRLLGLTQSAANALKHIYQDMYPNSAEISLDIIRDDFLSEIGGQWYSNLISKEDRSKLSRVFLQDEELYHKAVNYVRTKDEMRSEL
jgi:hypothetical protein